MPSWTLPEDAALTLPEDEVHQCNEGHCYCSQRPTTCEGAASGCGWAGMAADKAAHEKACVIAVCQRMMAPLQGRCDGLQAQNEQLQQQVAALLPLQAQNQQLQQQVAALQPLAGRVRALEGVETEEGGRRQRQRVGAAPHDAPPSDAAVQGMGVVAAVAVLQAHVAAARVVEAACCRVAVLCREESNRQTAAEAGAFEAVVVAVWAHPQVASVQRHSCRALSNGCIVSNAAGQARKQRAGAAGALEAVVAAMQAHWQDVGMLERGCAVLNNMVCHPFGSDATVQARKQRAGAAGALEAVVAAMQAHRQVVGIQHMGCKALNSACHGTDAAALARRQRAMVAGGREAAAAAMQAHPGVADVQQFGQKVINLLG